MGGGDFDSQLFSKESATKIGEMHKKHWKGKEKGKQGNLCEVNQNLCDSFKAIGFPGYFFEKTKNKAFLDMVQERVY